MRIFASFLLFCGLLTAVPPVEAGQDVTVSAEVDRAVVELGSFLQLVIRVEGAQDVAPVQLPEIDGLQTRYVGPSTNVSIVNGQVLAAQAFRYNLYPTATGRYTIPAIQVMVAGQTYQTQPIPIEVVTAQTATQTGAAGDPSVSLKDKVFISLSIPKEQYYVYEKIPLTVGLYINNLVMRDIHYPQMEHTGFTMDDFQSDQQFVKRTVGGVVYDTVEFRTNFYPTRPGEQTLGPAQISGDIVFKNNTRSRRSGGFGGLFDDEFLNNFLGGGYDTRTVTMESADLKVQVLPLPEAGRPDDFSGAVGVFDFTVEVSPREVKVGDPVTIRMTAAGTGNLENVRLPQWAASKDWKFYDPQVRVEGRQVIAEQVAIPERPQVTELPAIGFSYFDTVARQYQTIQRGPFPIQVRPLQQDERLKVVGLDTPVGAPAPVVQEEALGQDINFIKTLPGSLTFRGQGMITRRLGFWLALLIFFAGWSGLLARFFLLRKLRTDTRFARRLQAPRHARQGLRQARQLLEQGDQRQFYDVLFKTVQGYFGNKFHLPSGAVSLERIREIVRAKGLDEELEARIEEILLECEQVRYASLAMDAKRMAASYRRAEQVIDAVERAWR